MTDNEIIKALEDAKARSICVGECDCNNKEICTEYLAKCTLDLINRQRAEIERLEAECEMQYEQAEANILANIADGGTSCHWCIAKHKAAAIKEFAERLEEKTMKSVNEAYYGGWDFSEDDVLDDIDNLVKEMVGGNDG